MPFVLDASATLPWCFRDEATAYTDRLLSQADLGEQIHVPSHWPLEILNGLTRAARRGRLDDGAVAVFLSALPNYDIVVDRTPYPEQWREARILISRYRLSAYDAAYLALAKRLAVPLATQDGILRDAARIEGVQIQT